MLDNKLIISSLELTGKTMEFCNETIEYEWMNGNKDYSERFSIEKFSYYLLSPEFIEKYAKITEDVPDKSGHTMELYRKIYFGSQIERIEKEFKAVYYTDIGKAIYKYQSGNETPLIELLSKICQKQLKQLHLLNGLIANGNVHTVLLGMITTRPIVEMGVNGLIGRMEMAI